MVGLGGSNGSTVVASILANRKKLSWATRTGQQTANYFGSLMMASTLQLGIGQDNSDVHVPMHEVLPMVHPNDFCLGGWDISGMNLSDAMDRAGVLEPDLKRQVAKEMSTIVPW